MITPLLEQLILDGKAKYKIFSAMAKSQILKVKQKTHIVIVDIWYNDFIDTSEDLIDVTPDRLQSVLNRTIHKLQLASKRQTDFIMIKDTVQISINPLNPTNFFIIDTYGQQHFNVYFKHKDDVYVDLAGFPDQSLVSFVNAKWSAKTGDPQTPNGYGNASQPTSLDVVNVFSFGAGQGEFRPVGDSVEASPVNNVSYTEANIPITAATAIINPNPISDTFTRSIPVINIGYVEILKNPDDTF